MNNEISSKLNDFFSQFPSFSYQKNEVILRAEDTPQGVYFVKNGYIRLYMLSLDGRELTFNIFKPGSFFSMMWAISNLPNSFYFQAMTEVDLYRAPKDKLVAHLKSNPDALFDLTQRILSGMDGLIAQMEFLLFGNAATRVISTILTSAKRFGEKNGNGDIKIKLPLTHQEIANIAGLTRETTSLEMKKLENEKLIDHEKKFIIVKNLPKLEAELETRSVEEPIPYVF